MKEINNTLEQMFNEQWTNRLNDEVEAVKNTIIANITRRYNAGQKFTHEDIDAEWERGYFNDFSLIDCVFVLTINSKGTLCMATDYKGSKVEDYEYYDELKTLPVEELLYIHRKMHN